MVTVAELPKLRGQPDEAVFAFAGGEGRAIVTENVPDFRLLVAAEVRAGRPHPTLTLTSDRAYPRRDRRTADQFVAALDAPLSGEDLRAGEYWL